MPKSPRILHAKGFHSSRSRADRAVYDGVWAWVEYGISVRSTTVEEMFTVRQAQAAAREPLESPELPGITCTNPTDWQLVSDANQFVSQGA